LLATQSFQLDRPVLGPLACPGKAVLVVDAEVPGLVAPVVQVVQVLQVVQAVQENLLMDLDVSL
jgi:hypothetical protein